MKIEIDKDYAIRLKEVYNAIVLESAEKETIAICMRDSGFEVRYMNKMYEFKNGKVPQTELKEDIKPCPFCGDIATGPIPAEIGWWIECESCEYVMDNENKERLIEKWNTRK